MNYPVKKVASAVTATLFGLAIATSVSAQKVVNLEPSQASVVGLNNGLAKRYIVTYKETAENTMMKSNGQKAFKSQSALNQVKSHGGKIKFELNEHRAIVAELDAKAVKALRNDPAVALVEEDQRRELLSLYNDDAGDPTTTQLTPYAIYQSQAKQLSLQPGMKVCVIDSGIAGSTGETGGKNNDFNWSNITGSNDSGTGNWNADGGPHGTHVAGTVAAVDNGFGVVGMAPGVPLHIVKVFNAAGWGYSSDLAQAATKCTQAGANIITMSLGGGASNTTEQNAFNTFTSNGGLVLAAAGNDGNSVRSFPAGYDSVMMIGANDGDNNIATFSQYPSCNTAKTNCVEATAGGVNTLSTYPAGGATVAGLSAGGNGYASSAMENTGSASGSTFNMGTAESTNSGANGKICMIDRGNISFHDKVKNCQNSGGIGAVIVNNVAGMLAGTLGTANTTTIPAVGAAFEDRSALMAASTASISVGAGDYGLMSGTSMATPGVAGIAALVWSNHQSCTGTQIRNALKATAADSGATGHDVYFGNGIVKAKAASDYITTKGCDGTGTGNNILPVASFTKSCSELACTFNGSASSDSDGTIASYVWSFGDGTTGTGVSKSHTYAADGTYTVSLTVTDNVGGNNTTTSTVTVAADVVVPPVGDLVLTNGVAKTGISASTGADVVYTMVVPAGATDIKFAMSGGTGDADMYVKFGSTPTDSTYDCRPYASGNTENCTGTQSGGTYYVRLKAYSAFSGVSLTGSFTEDSTPPGLTPIDSTISNISVSRRAWKRYTVDLVNGYSNLVITMSGGSGDADLYVRRGAQSTTSAYDCRPYKTGNNESCTFTAPAAGTWYIDVYGYSTSSGITLNVKANP